MPRDSRVYLEDILHSIGRIRRHLEGRPWKKAARDEKTFDAVVRNIEVIGEAVKHLPAGLTREEKHVEWRKIAAMRDILAHEYFGVDEGIIGDVVENKLEGLEQVVQRLLSEGGHGRLREKQAIYVSAKPVKRKKKSCKKKD